mgnify:FL=1
MPVLDLGSHPPSDKILTAEQLSQHEAFYPLEVVFCPDCALVQILETVPPEVLFGEDYPISRRSPNRCWPTRGPTRWT